jgi:hypothetical protein
VQLLERAAQAVDLIHEMKDDIDALVVDPEIVFEIPDEPRPRNVHVGEGHSGRGPIWNQPLLLDPEIQYLHLQTRASQELLPVHAHDVMSSRGLNIFPFSHVEMNASSSGSDVFGKTTFSLTSSSP